MNDLEKSILKTLAFFDIFSYPLTVSEIWKWLFKPAQNYKLSDIKYALENSRVLQEKLSSKEAFYYIKGRDSIYLRRKQNNNLAERKFRRAIYLAKAYRFIPFVKMIAVCNSLSYSNASEKSDIDLFIISKRGTIWLARFFTILFVSFLRMRPTEENKQDTFCLSFFVDEGFLDIQNSMMGSDDIYYPYWVATLMPIYDPDKIYERFLEANSWYKTYLPNAYPNVFSKEVKRNKFFIWWGKISGWIICPPPIHRFIYNIYRTFQVRIIDKNLKALINIDTRVIVNERMLKFYSNDNREFFYKKWREKVHYLLDKNETT